MVAPCSRPGPDLDYINPRTSPGTNARRILRRAAPWLALAAIAAWLGGGAATWSARNVLMDGYQNEYLHVGNTLDLWAAWEAGDRWQLGYLLGTNYWPPGFYLWPAPLFALGEASYRWMVFANIGHLVLLLWACFRLGEALRDREAGLTAAALVAVYPSIAGNMVRFEPNVALTAWVTVGALALVRSRAFADRRWSLLFALACAAGLMMDRLSLALFLALPAAVVGLGGLRRRGPAEPGARARLVNALLALGLLVALVGWWHWNFALLHRAEILSQVGVGEIDATQAWTEQRSLSTLGTWIFYPAVLLDEQAGLVPGALGMAALAATIAAARRGRLNTVPALVVLSSVGLFTIIQKKQIYYSIPMLGCLAVITAERLRALGGAGRLVAAATILVGVHQVDLQMWGRGLPLPAPVDRWLGAPSLPGAWVDRRYPQARQPRDLPMPVGALAAATCREGSIAAFSDDHTWYEGFLVLGLRERAHGRRVRGLISDPHGTYEWFRTAGTFVYVSTDPAAAWPTVRAMEATLEQHNYTLSELPPVVELIRELSPRWREVGRWPLPHGGVAVVFWNGDEGCS